MGKYLFVIILFILSSGVVFSQDDSLSIKHFDIIKQKRITAIAIDTFDNKWFGSEYGFYHYLDTLTHYSRENNPELSENHISCIYSTDSLTYFGTYNSLIIKLDKKRKISYIDLSKINIDTVNTLGLEMITKVFHKHNYLWVVLRNIGIVRFNELNNEVSFFKFDNIRDFVINKDSINWVGTSKGLFYSDNISTYAESYTKIKKIKGEITKMDLINDTLVLANYYKNISTLWKHSDSKRWKKIKAVAQIRNNRIRDFTVDSSSNIWLVAGYAARYNGKWKVFDDKEYKSKLALCVDVDRKNNIWIGTEGYGVYTISKNVVSEENQVSTKDSLEKVDTTTMFQGEKLVLNKEIEISNLLFDINKDELLAQSKPKLDEIFEILNKKIEYNLLVEGHTAKTRYAPLFYRKLSEARALSVKNYLVEKGIDEARIITKGYGATKIKKGLSPKDKKNRRVVMTFIYNK